MPDDRDDWRWIDEHIERPTPEIATDAVLAQRGEDARGLSNLEGTMDYFGQIDAVYTDGGSVWAHPSGGAPGLPPDHFLRFGPPGPQGAATFSAVVTHAKATGSNVWLYYAVSGTYGEVSSMYVF